MGGSEMKGVVNCSVRTGIDVDQYGYIGLKTIDWGVNYLAI